MMAATAPQYGSVAAAEARAAMQRPYHDLGHQPRGRRQGGSAAAGLMRFLRRMGRAGCTFHVCMQSVTCDLRTLPCLFLFGWVCNVVHGALSSPSGAITTGHGAIAVIAANGTG
jgi:hypothetical protein